MAGPGKCESLLERKEASKQQNYAKREAISPEERFVISFNRLSHSTISCSGDDVGKCVPRQ